MTESTRDAASGAAARGDFFRPPFAAAINHLLKSASWARNRLVPHAGKTACFALAPFTLALVVTASGEVQDLSSSEPHTVRIDLTAGVALRMLAGGDDAWREARIDGDIGFARDILYVAQNLHWDVEEDLSRVFGDIAAHRLVQGGNRFRQWQRDSAEHLARSAAIYWTEEQPLIATRYDVELFVREVDDLRDDVERAEKRLDNLINRHTPA
jgi:ubiquinone biosynthesis accessory factor UbiJ